MSCLVTDLAASGAARSVDTVVCVVPSVCGGWWATVGGVSTTTLLEAVETSLYQCPSSTAVVDTLSDVCHAVVLGLKLGTT